MFFSSKQKLIYANRRKENWHITALYGLAEHCGFGQLHNELICDHIVVGIRDLALSENLQLDPNLDLPKAVNAVRQSETVKKQQATIRGTAISSSTDKPIDAVHNAKLQKQKSKQTRLYSRQSTEQTQKFWQTLHN